MITIVFILFSLVTIIGLILFYLSYKMRSSETILENSCLSELFSFMTNHGGHFLSHLMFLNDKYGYYAANRSVYFSFQKKAGRIVVLGDPIGDQTKFKEAVNELQVISKSSFTKQPIFYQISSNYKEMYEQLHYKVIKIGEEAKVYLPDFNLEGKKKTRLRTPRNKLEREGFIVKVVSPPHSSSLMNEVKLVSDAWLGNRTEKGFSVSYFDSEYISRFPIALLLNKEGQVVAFATLPSHDQNGETTIHIDLMRYLPDSPNGVMDYLFTSVFFWGKDQGYHYCSLGMAPLSNVCANRNPRTLYEWTANFMYEHGESFYKFKGLKDFKAKFATHWEPRYIAYKRTTTIGVLFRLIVLIHHKRSEKSSRAVYHLLKKVS
ncbi:phosphatidylglycerol lysyltransferase domain-containing protein [Bacillus sp. AK128]